MEQQTSQEIEIHQKENTPPTSGQLIDAACQTDPNLIDKLIDNHVKKQLDDIDLYQEYVRSAQCAQFWPLDKNPIRSLVPSMLKVDLPEQHLKNESLMFDLVQAITNNSKLVNLLAKYVHHIVPNVIISKRIDLIPLITCTIRVCRDTNEQERLMSLLFNLIKRPNEEQRRMILSGIIVVLQVSPNQSSSLLLPNLWDHVNDKFPERRILLAESCATLAHYVRPVIRTNLVLSILIQLLKDKNAAVRSAACKSFSCLLTLIMDRNDEVFDACLSATEDIIQDVLQQTPMNFCENRYELEQMRFCTLETVYPLLCMWAVKLNRFKVDIADFYMAKAEKFFANLLATAPQNPNPSSPTTDSIPNYHNLTSLSSRVSSAVAKRRSIFFDSRSSSVSGNSSTSSASSLFFGANRRQSAFVGSANYQQALEANGNNCSQQTSQRAVAAYLKMLNYSVSFVFSDAVHSCAWLSKSKLSETKESEDKPLKFLNKLLDPTLIIDESAIIAFHDQLEQEHMLESLDWILSTFIPKFLSLISHFSHKRFYSAIGGTSDIIQDFLSSSISGIRQLCLLFGRHLTRSKIRPLIKQYIKTNNSPSLYSLYITSLTSFEPIEQQEFEEIVVTIRQSLNATDLTRDDIEILALSIKVISTNTEQIHSPSTRQKFLTYILDALVNYSNGQLGAKTDQQTQTKEFMIIIFRHILTCLIDQSVRPTDWAHILVTKFLPLIISLANDSADVHVCTYARLMCAQLVETFDTYLHSPKLTKQSVDAILPALNSLKGLTEQIKASNLRRQIEFLIDDLKEKFFKDETTSVKTDENNNNNFVADE